MIATDYLEALGKLVPIISGMCAIIGALGGWIIASRRHRYEREEALSKREKALADGVTALLRSKLVKDYETHIARDGQPVSHFSRAQRMDVDSCYQAYKALGGNGQIDDIYEKLTQVPIYIVGESE